MLPKHKHWLCSKVYRFTLEWNFERNLDGRVTAVVVKNQNIESQNPVHFWHENSVPLVC